MWRISLPGEQATASRPLPWAKALSSGTHPRLPRSLSDLRSHHPRRVKPRGFPGVWPAEMRTATARPAAADAAGFLGMTWIAGGEFTLGPDASYPDERPVRRAAVERFWMDTRPVTISDLRRFVTATGFETVGKQPLRAPDSRDTDPDLLVPGSLVFLPTAGPADLGDDVRCREAIDTATDLIGFRCVIPPGPLLARPGVRPAHAGPEG